MSAQHTPGRLVVRGGYSIYTVDGTPVADTCVAASIPITDEANARRLVACWNACEGIRTEALEHRAHLLKAEDSTIADLHAQRDELLAALRRLSLASLCRDSTSGDPCRLIEAKAELAAAAKHADAAIAKVEGEKT